VTDRSPKPQSAQDLLWMFRHAEGPAPSEVAFEPSDAIYHLSRQTRNPYLERAIAPPARKLERSPADLQRLFRFFGRHGRYAVAPTNAEPPFDRRSLAYPAPPPQAGAAYVGPERLPGDLRRLPWMVSVFFRAVLERLRAHPSQFRAVVEELLEQFREDGIRIKLYDAYQTFRDWDDLLATLDEIARYPAPETFDLFCSALLTYYELAFPPAGD
jgi:hypothetical protein